MSKSLKLIIESLLFSSDRPLTAGDINSCLPDTDKADIKSALKILQHEYDSMARSFELKEVAKGFQFRSRPEYGAYILRFLQTSPNRLSKAAMETLAIIAYKQPILRQEIELLRGVDVGGIIRTLMEKGLVRIVGRKDLPGKPLIYGTTNRFLEVFDLKDIRSLPKLKEIKTFGTDDYEPTLTSALKEAAIGHESSPLENLQENAGAENIEAEITSDQNPGGNPPEQDQEKDTGDESQGQKQEQDTFEQDRDRREEDYDKEIFFEQSRQGFETEDREGEYQDTMDDQAGAEKVIKEQDPRTEDTDTFDTGTAGGQDAGISGDAPGREAAD